MEKMYSEMTEYELKQEIANLREKARKAEQMGMVNEFAVHERKAIMAESYLMNPKDIKDGEIYRLKNEPGTFFRVLYKKGVFAWGYRLNGDGKEEGIPISMLEIEEDESSQ
ncbi:YfhH family protein [Pallidibacillus pasinlerensis]|uniref:YfhH family protein n=1 Tax=Pallidibacillus pasinlerensis TaxID=2703818 RepID=A0ABX0A8U8_9BACI|nr:YfhH family protein [Pallidibacillus pasinlerensis]NCU17618.1 YfhH family protein [Pallidibacillus pasinlerensis]